MNIDKICYLLREGDDEIQSAILFECCKEDETFLRLLSVAMIKGKIVFCQRLGPDWPTPDLNVLLKHKGVYGRPVIFTSTGNKRLSYVIKLIKNNDLTVNKASIIAWYESVFSPQQDVDHQLTKVSRTSKFYSDELKALDEAYRALYMDSEPSGESANDEKKRIEDWLSNNYELIKGSSERIASVLNPFRFPSSGKPPKKNNP